MYLRKKQLVRSIYSLLVKITWHCLTVIAKFHPKIKLFVDGRKATFKTLELAIQPSWRIIWVHVASLGEYEQGLPLIEHLKKQFPDHNILLTFFSPSGYEVKKDKTPATLVTYLPLDTIGNAKRFLEIVRPELAIFVKYEVWPNYLSELSRHKVPTLLVSGIFKEKQAYFHWYGRFLKQSLGDFTHFFVQDEKSKILLKNIGFENVTVSGDTRFDRVAQILQRDNQMPLINSFKRDHLCLVAGSTWPEDEKVLLPFINTTTTEVKFIIAPHTIKKTHIQQLEAALSKKAVLYSELENQAQNPEEAQVVIVDSIGLLTKIYSYADIAYVGGGFATGLHNTLEPAVFGIPVIIGPNYSDFVEATDLVQQNGILAIQNSKEFEIQATQLLQNASLAKKTGTINFSYIQKKVGATKTIMEYITKLI